MSLRNRQCCDTAPLAPPKLGTSSVHNLYCTKQEYVLQASADSASSSASAGGAKSGMASLMRRAVQQAKAEAAAQAAAGGTPAHDNGQTAVSLKAPEAPANGKRALAAMLQKAAQKMQEAEAGPPLHAVPSASSDSKSAVRKQLEEDTDLSATIDAQLSSLYEASTRSGWQAVPNVGTLHPSHRQQSLGDRLGSIFKNMLSPSRQSSYIPLDADGSPEAAAETEEALESSGQVAHGRRAPPRHASLGERLGSVLNTALSLPRHSSYTAVSMEEPSTLPEPLEYPGEASEDPGEVVEDLRDPAEHHGRRSLPRDASLGQRLGSLLKGVLSLPRQSSYMSVDDDEEVDDAAGSLSQQDRKSSTIQRELSLHDRYSSLSRQSSQRYSSSSKQSSHSFLNEMFEVASSLTVGNSPGSLSLPREPSLGINNSPPKFEVSDETTVVVSPSKTRAPPRDAAHPPDLLTRTLGQTSTHHRDGSTSPKSRLGPSFSSTSVASDFEDQGTWNLVASLSCHRTL